MPRRNPAEVEPYEEPYDERQPSRAPRADYESQRDDDHDAGVIIEAGEDGITKKVKLDLEIDTTAKDLGPNPFISIMHLAEAIDSWRIFPRIFITVYIFLLYEVVTWAMRLENISLEQSGLVSIIVGAGAAWFGLYVGSGRSRSSGISE